MSALDQVLSLMAEYVERTGFPLPVPKGFQYRWAEPLGLPRRGRVYLYTGALYQLAPYVEALVEQLERVEERPGAGIVLRLARAVSRVVDLSKIAVRPDPARVEQVERVLRSVAGLLRAAGVKYAYLYEDDLYSGILLYDMGLDEAFERHARRVYARLRERGAEKVITVDPHTTRALRQVYPEYVPGFDLEVVSYLEVLDEALGAGRLRPSASLGLRAVIHDPCVYARFLGIVEQPRRLLRAAGVELAEPPRSRRMTYCCGGPAEAVLPALARRIAETRMGELAGVGDTVVTLCPICLVNLGRAARGRARVVDAAELLARAFGAG